MMGEQSYPNGDKPVTQITRDQMAQSDHDKLVEYGVMLQNIMAGQIRLEAQIKDLIQGQAASLAAWEASSKAVHDAHDLRIRKLEDLSVQYVPMATDFQTRITNLEKDNIALNENRSYILGGWRGIAMLLGGLAWLIGISVTLINISMHLPRY